MKKLKYVTVMNAEQSPDCYAGKDANEHIPLWKSYADGDMDSLHSNEDLVLNPKQFPAGTRVIVQEPVCPKCGMVASCCIAVKKCNFDWKKWADLEFA